MYKGFIAQGSSAKLRLNGKNRSKMARLLKTAGPGSATITLDSIVDWKAGETIGIAPTGYYAFENERIKIKSITNNVIQLEQPLKYSHLGNAIDKFQGQTREFVLNPSAEVVLLSRNILIQADELYSQLASEQEGSDPGGHVMIHPGGKAYINSVEFYKMGQAGIFGRYPFHWHNLGDISGQFISNSSVHYSFQRCITIHGTSSTLVENNVCQDFRGHGLFLEDGNEINDEIKGNILIGALYPHDTKHILRSDFRGVNTSKDRFPSVSSFWISNPNNSVYNNIAAGSVGTGFWNSFEGDIVKINTKRFSDNTAHGALVGITWDGARGNSPIEASISFNNPDDKITDSAHYNPPTHPYLKI